MPPTVDQSFHKDNPTAVNPRWRRNKEQWHASYKDRNNNNRNVETYYDQRGNRVDTHTSWEKRDIPEVVDRKVYSSYHTRNYQATKIDRPNGGALFQLSLNLGRKAKTIYTDEHANETKYRDSIKKVINKV